VNRLVAVDLGHYEPKHRPPIAFSQDVSRPGRDLEQAICLKSGHGLELPSLLGRGWTVVDFGDDIWPPGNRVDRSLTAPAKFAAKRDLGASTVDDPHAKALALL